MEQSGAQQETDVRSRLLESARAFVLAGEQKFSISQLCAAADVPRDTFRAHFSGKTQLMAALMADAQVPCADTAPQPDITPQPEPVPVAAPTPAPARQETVEPTPKAASEPSVSTPDAWLERRLRVFERALTALEAKADARERDQARIIAELEEKLAKLDGPERQPEIRPLPASLTAPAEARPVAAPAAAPAAAHVEPLENLLAVHESEEDEAPEVDELEDRLPSPLELPPAPSTSMSREAMAEVVQLARGKVRAAAAEQPLGQNVNARTRWLAIGALALLVLFLCVGLSLGKGALSGGASAATEGDGVAHRHIVQSPLARLTALADSGDAVAQAKLALIYLKGDGAAADPAAALRWSRAAAQAGEPVAEYLMGSFYREGNALAGGLVKVDPVKAFAWFDAAATKGNLKAMHNLAIAYAEGLGTAKDEKKAAEWFTRAAERGYVDSAFDLAVLYERGLGVTQDLKQALTWYGIAAQMGDVPAEERVTVLRGQISHEAADLAATAAKTFTPVPPLGVANRL